jgi:hypothetical protein
VLTISQQVGIRFEVGVMKVALPKPKEETLHQLKEKALRQSKKRRYTSPAKLC